MEVQHGISKVYLRKWLVSLYMLFVPEERSTLHDSAIL